MPTSGLPTTITPQYRVLRPRTRRVYNVHAFLADKLPRDTLDAVIWIVRHGLLKPSLKLWARGLHSLGVFCVVEVVESLLVRWVLMVWTVDGLAWGIWTWRCPAGGV